MHFGYLGDIAIFRKRLPRYEMARSNACSSMNFGILTDGFVLRKRNTKHHRLIMFRYAELLHTDAPVFLDVRGNYEIIRGL